MILDVSTGFLRPATRIADATSLLVRDQNGAPLLFVLQRTDGTVYVKAANEPDFVSTMRSLGVSITTDYNRFVMKEPSGVIVKA